RRDGGAARRGRRPRVRSGPSGHGRHRGSRARHPLDARARSRAQGHADDRRRPGARDAHRRRDPPGDGTAVRTKIRLALAADPAILRAGLRMLLDAQPDMMVVAEASDGLEAVRRAHETRPDVAVIDLTMPGLSGVETLERLHRELPATRLLVLTMHD